jgi:hypothetical protein
MNLQEAIDRLRERTRMPLFVVSVWDETLDEALQAAPPEELFEGFTVQNPQMGPAVLAGLHLWNDNWEASHNLLQVIKSPTGSYLHGLCHRREGHRGEGLASNLANAKYWFRQAGEHPVFDAVYRSALSVLDSGGVGFRWVTEAADQLRARRRWDPNTLIDWFAQADDGTLSSQTTSILEEIQWREIDLLVDWCAQQAREG